MDRRIIVSLVALGALAACVHESPPTPAAAGMAWSLTTTPEEGAKLAYGAPDTDNLVLMLTCLPKSGEVQVWLMGAEAAKPGSLILSSGERTARFPVRRSDDGYEALHAAAPASDAVFASFAGAGTLGFSLDGRRTVLPAAGGDARKFVASCRR